MPVDPYTLVYNEICTLLRASVAVVTVAPRIDTTLIDFDKGHGQDQEKDALREADLPEVQVWQSTLSGNFNLASNAVEVVRSYRLVLFAGTGRIGATLNPLEFAITCALADANFRTALRVLAWHGQHFVKAVSFGSADSGTMEGRDRGIIGWAANWNFDIQMVFALNAMQQFNRGETVTDPTVV